MAVHLLASQGRTVVAGDLDQITIKDGVKAVIKFSSAAPSLPELYSTQNKAVLVVVANHHDHTAGMDVICGESDQRAMDLGHEYDPNSDGKGMDDDNATDGKIIAIEHRPLDAELEQAYKDGYQAASEGEPQTNCPLMKGPCCIQWIKGWKAWHEESGEDDTNDLGGEAA